MPVARLVAPGPESASQVPGLACHARHDIGRKACRTFMRGENELYAAGTHRLHERQHVSAGHAVAVGYARSFQRGYDQVSVVHGV